MITKLILDAVFSVVGWFTSLLPTGGPPGWFSQGASALASVWGYADGLGAWIPWSLAGTIVAAVFASSVIGIGVRTVRIVLSLFTGGGGSAA